MVKLSEILPNYPKKSTEDRPSLCWDDAIYKCDREIEICELGKALFDFEHRFEGRNFFDLDKENQELYHLDAERFISTMPTWLKRGEK